MKFIGPCIAAAIFLMSLNSISQEKSKRLLVGDKVPNIELNGMYNYPTKTGRLSDFKGKAIILDFWSKDCHSCIASFPKMEKLQEEFKDELVILLVNDQPSETREALDYLFKNSPVVGSTKLPMVLGDSDFANKSEIFPHYAVGIYYWIDKNGILQACTMSHEITRENIQKLIKGEKLNVDQRFDILDKAEVTGKSWLSVNEGQFLNKLRYYKSEDFIYVQKSDQIDLSSFKSLGLGERYHSLFMKPIDGGNLAYGKGPVLDKNNKIIGKSDYDVPISRLFFDAYYYNGLPPTIGFFVEGVDSLDLKTRYTYEFTHPHFSDSLFNRTLREDLADYFGYKAAVEIRSVECYILFRTDKQLKLPLTKGGSQIWDYTMSERGTVFQNKTISILQSHLSRYSKIDKFGNRACVLDETGIDYSTKIDMTLYGNLENVYQLNIELSKYGLGIKKESRNLPVLVLRKVGY